MNPKPRRPLHKVGRPAAVAGAVLAVALVAACGTSPDATVQPNALDVASEQQLTPSAAPTTEPTTGPEVGPTAGPTTGPAQPQATRGHDARAKQPGAVTGQSALSAVTVTPLQAAVTATKAVPGSRVVSIELDREHGKVVWEVEVVTATASRELAIDAAKGTIVSNKADDQDDVAEDNRNLNQARLTYADAIRIAVAAVSGGQVVSAELEIEDGRLVWDLDLVTKAYVKYDVHVDAVSGAILKKALDR